MFAPTSFWNQRLPKAPPIDPDSAAFIANLLGQIADAPATIQYRDYAATIWYAGASAIKQRVWLDKADAVNPALRAALAEVPVPYGMRPAGPFPGDNEIMAFDLVTDTYYEFNQMRQKGVDTMRTAEQVPGCSTLNEAGWHCVFATVIPNASQSPGNAGEAAGHVGVGISGSGLHSAAGPIKIEEILQGRIRHPIKIEAIGTASGKSRISTNHRWPATNSDGEDTDPTAPQEGMIFWLPEASVDKPASAFMKIVARGANEHGLILCDGSASHVTIKGASMKTTPGSQSYGVDAWLGPEKKVGGAGAILTAEPTTLAAEFPWADLQVVDASYRPSTLAPGVML